MEIREGYAFAPSGRGREQAQKAIKATEEAGLDPKLVRTTSGGYLIPLGAVEFYTGSVETPDEEVEQPNVPAGEQVEGTGGEAGGDATAAGAGDGDAGTGDDAGAGADATGTQSDGPERPAGNASTEVWQQYAIAQGLPEEEATKLSRAELVEKYPAPAE